MGNRIGESIAASLKSRWREANEKISEKAAEGLAQIMKDADGEELRKNVREVLEWMESAPNFALFILNLLADERSPLERKMQIGVTLFYILGPIDALPAWLIGPVGLMDEALAAVFLVFLVIRWICETDEEVILENWPGEDKQIDGIMKVLEAIATLGGLGSLVDNAARPQWRKRLEGG